MVVWLILALCAAALEAFAVQKNIRKLEFFAKPVVMVLLLIWLYVSTGLQGNMLWFGLGLVFALVGDVVLLSPSDRMFAVGWSTFLLTHVFYIIGFKEQLLSFTAWSFILIFLLFTNGLRLIRRMAGAMQANQQTALIVPVIVYSLTISTMLYAAMSTIFDPAWKTSAAFFVSVGASLFYLSDLILAWNKFVSPINNGRLLIIITYHLAQIGLIAGIILTM
jgi:alkenylglycerophosphocholine hydrolase